MKLALHIVWKDFLRLRWGLATWWTLLAGKLGLGFALIYFVGDGQWPQSGHGSAWWSEDRLGTLLAAIGVLERVLAYFLTAILVQEDALVGSSPFWVTRPISGGRLLVAKFTGWLVLLWLSGVVLTLPWWIACGFGGREIAQGALELLAFQAVAALPAALAASLTDTLSRAVVWSLVLVAAVGMSTPAIVSALVPNGVALPSLAWLVVPALAVMALTVIVRQYFVRRWIGSVKVLGLGMILVPGLVALLAMNFGGALGRFAAGLVRWEDWHAERAQGVALQMHSFYAEPAKTSDVLSEHSLYSYLAAGEVPRGKILMQGDGAQQSWRWPNGLVLQRNTGWVNTWGAGPSIRLALGVGAVNRDEETDRYQRKQDDERASKQSAEYRERTSLMNVTYRKMPGGVTLTAAVLPSSVKRMKQTPPAYEATVQLRLVQPEPWIEVPLARSGWQAHAGFGFRLGSRIPPDLTGLRAASTSDQDRDNASGQFAFPVVATMPDFLWDSIFAYQFWLSHRWKQPQLYVINRTGGDLMGKTLFRTPRISIAGVGLLRETVYAWAPTLRRGDRWVARDPLWVDEAKVVLVGMREEARFTREVRAAQFVNPP